MVQSLKCHGSELLIQFIKIGDGRHGTYKISLSKEDIGILECGNCLVIDLQEYSIIIYVDAEEEIEDYKYLYH